MTVVVTKEEHPRVREKHFVNRVSVHSVLGGSSVGSRGKWRSCESVRVRDEEFGKRFSMGVESGEETERAADSEEQGG